MKHPSKELKAQVKKLQNQLHKVQQLEAVFPDPPNIYIGNNVDNSYSSFIDDWEEKLKNNNISQKAIDSIRNFIQEEADELEQYYEREYND